MPTLYLFPPLLKLTADLILMVQNYVVCWPKFLVMRKVQEATLAHFYPSVSAAASVYLFQCFHMRCINTYGCQSELCFS
jgi:hypothetical protein